MKKQRKNSKTTHGRKKNMSRGIKTPNPIESSGLVAPSLNWVIRAENLLPKQREEGKKDPLPHPSYKHCFWNPLNNTAEVPQVKIRCIHLILYVMQACFSIQPPKW